MCLTIGYGAGTRDPGSFPNVVRLSIGESSSIARGSFGGTSSREEVSGGFGVDAGRFNSERIAVLECAVDDLDPQVAAHCAQLALDRGALDVMSASVVMKKGRMGTLITLLCKVEQAAEFEDLLFRETSTLGIRARQEQRVLLDRRMEHVETQFGVVRVKVGSSSGKQFHAQPEFEDCRRLAVDAGVPLKVVLDAAMLAFSESQSKVRA